VFQKIVFLNFYDDQNEHMMQTLTCDRGMILKQFLLSSITCNENFGEMVANSECPMIFSHYPDKVCCSEKGNLLSAYNVFEAET
jgi:hypothetical protein